MTTPAPASPPTRRRSVGVPPKVLQRGLEAAFGGPPPGLVGELVDPKLAAQHVDDNKLCFVFDLGDDENPRVRYDAVDEEGVVLPRIAAVEPRVAGRVAGHKGEGIISEFSPSGLQLLLQIPQGGYEDDLDLAAGALGTCWIDGRELTLTVHEACPADAPAALRERLEAYGAHRGRWVAMRDGDAVVRLVWITEGLSPHLNRELFLNANPGAAARATWDALTSEGHDVLPIAFETGDGRPDAMVFWSVRKDVPIAEASTVPFLDEDGTPDPVRLGELLARTVLPPDADAARALAPALLQAFDTTRAPAAEAAEAAEGNAHLDACWAFLVARLGEVPPPERVAALQDVVTAAGLLPLQQEAMQLAVARYLLAHPDVEPPATITITAEIRALDLAALTARAVDLSRRFQEASGAMGPERLDRAQLPGSALNPSATRDSLERVQTGNFSAAEGPLHELLSALGPGGYENDPEVASLKDLELGDGSPYDADSVHGVGSPGMDAIIAEALAADDDDL